MWLDPVRRGAARRGRHRSSHRGRCRPETAGAAPGSRARGTRSCTCRQRGSAGLDGGAFGEPGPRLRTGRVARLDPFDLEPGSADQLGGVAGEVAASSVSRFWAGSKRRCQVATEGSGDRPCSRKWNRPPARSTRRTSASAASTPGIVHRVKVDRAPSQLSSSRGIDSPWRAMCSTWTWEAAIRSSARRRAVNAGSTA